MTYTKTVTIVCNDLGKSVTWMFCFLDPPNAKIFKEYYPLAWKVVTIPATGNHYFSLTYTSELVFTKSPIYKGDIVEAISAVEAMSAVEAVSAVGAMSAIESMPTMSAASWKAIKPGFKTVLEGDDEVGYTFTDPVSFGGDNAVVINGTNTVQRIGVGFAHKGTPDTVLCYTSVGVQDQVVANFTAVLNGYTTTDYKEKQSLKASIQDAAVRWTINMMDASAPTDYVMKYHSDTGVFEIVSA